MDRPLKLAELVRHDLVLALHSLLISAASLLLVAGLVATPTNCGCGAGTPHPHSLFLLPRHHHTSAGRHVRLHAPAEHAHALQAAAADGPRLAAFSGHASERIALAAVAVLGLTVLWRRLRWRWIQQLHPVDYHRAPEPPPPQLSLLGLSG